MLSVDLAAYANRGGTHYDRLVRIGQAVPLRLWTGDCLFQVPGTDAVDPLGLYRGDGTLVTCPPVRRMSGGLAEEVAFDFFGADPIVRSWVDDAASDIVGSLLTYGTAFFDERCATAGIVWSATYRIDQAIDSFAEAYTKVSLLCSSLEASRSTVENATWSDATQRTLNPADAMLSRAAGYAPGTSPVWG